MNERQQKLFEKVFDTFCQSNLPAANLQNSSKQITSKQINEALYDYIGHGFEYEEINQYLENKGYKLEFISDGFYWLIK